MQSRFRKNKGGPGVNVNLLFVGNQKLREKYQDPLITFNVSFSDYRSAAWEFQENTTTFLSRDELTLVIDIPNYKPMRPTLKRGTGGRNSTTTTSSRFKSTKIQDIELVPNYIARYRNEYTWDYITHKQKQLDEYEWFDKVSDLFDGLCHEKFFPHIVQGLKYNQEMFEWVRTNNSQLLKSLTFATYDPRKHRIKCTLKQKYPFAIHCKGYHLIDKSDDVKAEDLEFLGEKYVSLLV